MDAFGLLWVQKRSQEFVRCRVYGYSFVCCALLREFRSVRCGGFALAFDRTMRRSAVAV
jgi:hypothetical protein